jgi:hypothetical protein
MDPLRYNCTQLYGRPYIYRDTVGFETILIFLTFCHHFVSQQIYLSLLTQFKKRKNCRRRSSQLKDHHGISSTYLIFSPLILSSQDLTVKFLQASRTYPIFSDPSADMLLKEHKLNFNIIRKTSVLHYGSIYLIAC